MAEKYISLSEFKGIDLKVAKIIEAEKIENSEKLLRLKIDLGAEERQLVAGIARNYQEQDLIGKEIIVITNLEPRKILGIESQGMLLAARDIKTDKIVLLTPDKDITPGSLIS